MSGHGFGNGELGNQLCMWRYPSLTKVGNLKRHASRILQLSQVESYYDPCFPKIWLGFLLNSKLGN